MRAEEKVKLLLEGKTIISKEPGHSMEPLINHRQPVRIAPCTWEDCKVGDIVYCKVHGKAYTHLVSQINPKLGCLITNNHGHTNGWTKKVYGKVIEVLKNLDML